VPIVLQNTTAVKQMINYAALLSSCFLLQLATLLCEVAQKEDDVPASSDHTWNFSWATR